MKAKISPNINHYLEEELFCQSSGITFRPEKSRHLYYFSNRAGKTGKKILNIIRSTYTTTNRLHYDLCSSAVVHLIQLYRRQQIDDAGIGQSVSDPLYV